MANNGWPSATFAELIERGDLAIGDGYRAKNNELGGSGLIFLRAGHVTDSTIDFAGVDRFHEELSERVAHKIARPGDAVITSKGNSTGRVTFIGDDLPPFVYSPHLSYWRSRDLNTIVPRFLYYWSRSAEFQAQLRGMSASTDMAPYISLQDQRRLRITLPPTATQRQIAEILGRLDDKIELNRRMNGALESMARALFKSWFIDFDPVLAKAAGRAPAGIDPAIAALFPAAFEKSRHGPIPQGWRIGALNDIAKSIVGGDWGSSTRSGDQCEATSCIRGADIPLLQECGLGKMPTRFIKKSSLEKRGLLNGDLAIEISGGSPTQSTGRAVLVSDALLKSVGRPITCSNFCRAVKLKSPEMSTFTYLWLRHIYDNGEFLQFENGTTGIKNLAFTVFAETYPMVIAPVEICKAFNQSVSAIFAARHANGIQSRTLGETRDALLPKLLSGELAVG